jgi:hypothetical protein
MLSSDRPVIGILAFVTVALAASTFVAASSTRHAGAACNGVGSPALVSRYDVNGTLVAQEYVAYPGTTCNGDATYAGAVLDPITDGSCAYVYYLEPLTYYANQGTSCSTGAWSSYSYVDTIGTNSVFVSARPSYLGDSWAASSGY